MTILTLNGMYEYSYGTYKAYAKIISLFETVINAIPINKVVDNTEQGNKIYGAVAESIHGPNLKKYSTFIIPDIDYFNWTAIENIPATNIPSTNRKTKPNFLLYKKDNKHTNLEIGDNTFRCKNGTNYNIDIKKFFKLDKNLQYTEYTNSKNHPAKNRNGTHYNTSYGCIGDISDGTLLKQNAFIPDVDYYEWNINGGSRKHKSRIPKKTTINL